jgi:nucleoside-diphosphate-sugar epimerase
MVSYANKRVFVTGATGFIGGRLAERLVVEHGADVRTLIRDLRQAVWLSRLPVTFVMGDVTHRDSLEQGMVGCDVVFHCVGVGGTVETCHETNVNGTRNVLDAAKAAGVSRVVYLSSSAVHGPNPPENADEGAPVVRTGAPYGDSKIAAEEVIAAFSRQSSSPSVVILRPTFVWGPRSDWYAVDQIHQLRQGTWQLVDQGRGTCHAVYVDNLVDAMLLAGQSTGAAGRPFLITDDQPITWAEFFQSFARMINVSTIPSVSSKWVRLYPVRKLDFLFDRMLGLLDAHMPNVEPFRFLFRASHYGIRKIRKAVGSQTGFGDWDLLKYARRGRLNTSSARTVLGYAPGISIAEGMRQTEQWLRDQRIVR